MNIFKRQWTEAGVRRWKASQEIGKVRWVMTHGVMGWGTTMFLLTTAVALFSSKTESELRTHLVIGMIIWPLAGLFWGYITWERTERSYEKYVERRVF
jgi:hypothetical protein